MVNEVLYTDKDETYFVIWKQKDDHSENAWDTYAQGAEKAARALLDMCRADPEFHQRGLIFGLARHTSITEFLDV